MIRTRKPPPPAPVKVCPETITKLLSEKPSGSQGEVLRISSDGDHRRNFLGLGGGGGGGWWRAVVEKFSKYFFGWFDLNRDLILFLGIQNNLQICCIARVSRLRSSIWDLLGG